MEIFACFGGGRLVRSGSSGNQLRQHSQSNLHVEETRPYKKTSHEPVAAVLEMQQEPEICPSPFRSANIIPIEQGGVPVQEMKMQDLKEDMFMFHASCCSSKSITHYHHGLTTSNPLANDHLEGHLLPAGLDLTSLQYLLDSAYAITNPRQLPQETLGPMSHGLLAQGVLYAPTGGAAPAGIQQGTSTAMVPLKQLTLQQQQQQQQPLLLLQQQRPTQPTLEAVDGPDLRSLNCEQLVRLCQPEDITSDLAGLSLIGMGRHSVACQALWRGARVAVKFTSSPSLHPSSSAIIKQALVSKALAHPNVMQHYSVRCCRLALAGAELPPPPAPPQGNCITHAAVPEAGGGGEGTCIASAWSAPSSKSVLGNVVEMAVSPKAAAAAAAAETVAVLHHLSGPATTGAAAANSSVDAVQVSDLFAGPYGACAVSAARKGTKSGLPPLLHTASGSNRIVKVPWRQHSETTQSAASTSPAAAATTLTEPACQQSCTTAAAAALSLPSCIGTANSAQQGALSAAAADIAGVKHPVRAASAVVYPTCSAAFTACDALGVGSAAARSADRVPFVTVAAATAPPAEPGAASTANATAIAATAGGTAAPPPPAAGVASAAAAAAPGTAIPPNVSFNSYEGFGDPFGPMRHALSLYHVAALVSATEGEYLTAIIMEHADKSTLHQAVEKGLFRPNHVWSGRVALRALLRTSLELAFALQHLHSRGVAHGSLRPANVLLKSSNIDRRGFTAKVSNFSLARVCLGGYRDLVLDPIPEGLQTAAASDREAVAAAAAATAPPAPTEERGGISHSGSRGSCGGGGGGAAGVGMDAAALPFWSPEQLCGVTGKPSDAYAFGVTLYFMATSCLPYTGVPAEEVVRGVVSGNLRPRWPDDVDGGAAAGAARSSAGAPPAFRALCAQCWHGEPRARPTFSQICASLQAIEYEVRQQLRK